MTDDDTPGATPPPTPKLFRVNVEIDLYVVAADLQAARQIARKHMHDELCIAEPHISATEIRHPDAVEAEWLDSKPYGDSGGKTCREIAEAIRGEREASNTSGE